MISIAEAISDLLFVRDTVVVPGLGAFVKKPTSVQVNPVANYFAMPSSEVAFDAALREDNDLVVNYLSEKNDIPKDEARKLLAMFVSDCFNSLKQGKKVVLNQIGTLSYDWADNLVFEQDKSVNYNADAFGLSDFSPKPVHRSKSKEEIKTEIEQQQKDKNTPITVDEKAVHERDNDDEDDEDEPRRGLLWLWILLGVLLVAGLGYGWYRFKNKTVPPPKPTAPVKPVEPVVSEPKTYNLPVYIPAWEVKEPEIQDTVRTQEANEVKESTQVGDTVKVQDTIRVEQEKAGLTVETDAEANIRIIAGCFDKEENAVRLVNSLKNKGYDGAFCEMRSHKWFVSFGRYSTDEEATTALREIRANTEYKAWILK